MLPSAQTSSPPASPVEELLSSPSSPPLEELFAAAEIPYEPKGGQQWLPARLNLRPEILALHKPVAQAQFEGVMGGRRHPAPKPVPAHANASPAAVVSQQARQVQPDLTPTPHCVGPDMIATEWADSSSDNESVDDSGSLTER